MQQDYEMFKIVVIGSMGTGKTNISTRYMKNQFNQSAKSTVGVEFMSKIVQVRNQSVKITLWDTAGQQRYKSLSKVYYKGASAILIVYDITDPQSYLDVESWMRLANQNININEVVLMVVGNKMDLTNRKVPSDRVQSQYKDKFDIDCWQVSAKTGQNIKQLFGDLIQKIYELNTKLKGSRAFDIDESNYDGSVVDVSVIKANKNMKKVGAAMPVTIEQSDDKLIGKNMIKQNEEKVIKKQVKPNDTNIKLNTKNQKKKQKEKDCSC